MRKIYIILIFITKLLFAQEIPPDVIIPEETRQNTYSYELPQVLTQIKIFEIFESIKSGKSDLFMILGEIKKTGYANLNVFYSLILEDEESEFYSTSDLNQENITQLKLFAFLALESIGTTEAFNNIMEIAESTTNTYLKEESLIAISENYHNKVIQENIVPSSRVIKIFLKNISDTAVLSSSGNSIQEICSDGLEKWVTEDTHKILAGLYDMVTVEKESWWETNASRLIWNNEIKYFEIN